jgi:hypothetical protein
MPNSYLTKQDFQRWMTCPTAAHHGWSEMKSKNEDDSFLKFLAEEGRIIGRAAHRLFRGGEHIHEKNLKDADRMTRGKLTDDATLFEACIVHAGFVVRPDILIRRDDTIYLIEVKSKVGDLKAHREGRMLINYYGDIRAAWREIVYDVAFQVEVLQRAFPGFCIVPYLLLPESTAKASASEVSAVREVDFTPAANDNELRERRSKSVLKFFAAQAAVSKIAALTSGTIDSMLAAWKSQKMPESVLRYQCRNCEFRLQNGGDPSDGLHKCWGQLAEPDPSIFELNQLYSLKASGKGQALLADAKIAAGQTSLYDISDSELHGEHAVRQRIQLQYQRENKEWIDPRLADQIDSLVWPIAFLDFETSMSGIPWYAGLKPYEVLPFEFSCHILHQAGRMEHTHWLNTEDRIPTLPFIRALMPALENIGSVLVYTDYEERVLADSRRLLARLEPDIREEQHWINELLSSGRIVDQHQWVHRHYFHPVMSGRTSIKKVLRAIWLSNPHLRAHDYFCRYYMENVGSVLDPYTSLRSETINGVDYSVREGCGAMAAYRELIRGIGSNDPEAKARLSAMLERYVTLDTASQWMLFEHWRQRLEMQ